MSNSHPFSLGGAASRTKKRRRRHKINRVARAVRTLAIRTNDDGRQPEARRHLHQSDTFGARKSASMRLLERFCGTGCCWLEDLSRFHRSPSVCDRHLKWLMAPSNAIRHFSYCAESDVVSHTGQNDVLIGRFISLQTKQILIYKKDMTRERKKKRRRTKNETGRSAWQFHCEFNAALIKRKVGESRVHIILY